MNNHNNENNPVSLHFCVLECNTNPCEKAILSAKSHITHEKHIQQIHVRKTANFTRI